MSAGYGLCYQRHLHILVDFRVARLYLMGNLRASNRGTSNNRVHVFFIKYRVMKKIILSFIAFAFCFSTNAQTFYSQDSLVTLTFDAKGKYATLHIPKEAVITTVDGGSFSLYNPMSPIGMATTIHTEDASFCRINWTIFNATGRIDFQPITPVDYKHKVNGKMFNFLKKSRPCTLILEIPYKDGLASHKFDFPAPTQW